MLIVGYLLSDKSNNLVHIRWLRLIQDFDRCSQYSRGSAVLAWTYISLSSAACCEMTDLGGYVPLVMSWIYHRFPAWGLAHLDAWRSRAKNSRYGGFWPDALDWIECFLWTPYGSDDLRFLAPELIRLVQRSAPDRVNLDYFLTTIGNGKDLWWPTHRSTRAWYESWMRHATDPVFIHVVAVPDFRGSQDYLYWWARACKSTYLSQDRLLGTRRCRLFHQTSARHPPSRDLKSHSRLMPGSQVSLRRESRAHMQSCSSR
ncbi:hypothetical protein PIB30_051821 [Stylosanthes scabra]|uniref:Aminotransferase-like plant mobile domain-containing protein n=1 Tax=Stylosanthes scabra TaxID=79078 RepID=A0ABU6WGJ1_9FABA|nr:hypothetical protein [Stylosanthes scabra]